MTEFAQRPHCIVAFPGTGTWMAPSDAVIQFLSNEQIKEMEEDGYPATPEHDNDYYERMFELPLDALIRWALERGYHNTLPPFQSHAIHTHVLSTIVQGGREP